MNKIKRIICGALCVAAIAIAVFTYFQSESQNSAASQNIAALTLWQIDGFEGGTGSRAAYLQRKADEYKQTGGAYVSVISLSADAARTNISAGNAPDIISFCGGEWGIDGALNTNYNINCWCYGAYCLLAIGENVDFSEVNAQNTVINEGKGNLSAAAAIFCGLYGAATQSSTYAYVDLINGKYKYLLGTQRDIYRLNARKVSYSVKALSNFNDLFQLIAVCSRDSERAAESNNFISYIMENRGDVYKLGLLGGDTGKNDYITPLEGLTFEYQLKTPVSKNTSEAIQNAVKTNNINKLKTLFK